jgi:transcription antitermination factor NusG
LHDFQVMITSSDGQRWYALQVRARWETLTASQLSSKGYKTFLPTFKGKRRRNSRLKEQTMPLFPGYVFCQFDVFNRLPILMTQGVLAVVGRGRIPVHVEDTEIAALQMMISSGLPVEPWPYLEVGQRVRIEEGALSGVEGILVNFKGDTRIILSVSLLRRSVSLEIDRFSVSPVRSQQSSVEGHSFAHETFPSKTVCRAWS